MNVPADILAQIKARAAAEWPGDYSMQAHTTNEQSEAYQQMMRFIEGMDQSNEITQTSMSKAKSDWPDDYSMQVYTFQEQTQDAINFFEYENAAIPEDTLKEIKVRAYGEWPSDYSMMLYTLNEQVEGWLAMNS